MNRIRLLSEQVANQIAAGEVVERPASVVKELVENALDAGASRIVVEVQAGGRSLIRVTDDGAGMSRDDALLCLERHATSKIERAEDLSAVATMGFRGEALPSIASVSRFVLTTREVEAGAEATQVVVHGGRILEVKSAGHATGTTVEVRQLFYNLPARRKFLRSDETERGHILHVLTLAALAHPETGFTVIEDGRPVWQLPPLKPEEAGSARLPSLQGRLRALWGADLKLLPVDLVAALDDGAPGVGSDAVQARVWGYIGAPGVSRSTRQDQHLFVNRRPIENRALSYALIEGYHNMLMKGRFPVCSLFLEIPPSEVDVNVHPSKREVKFHQEGAVRRLVANAVRQTLVNFHARSTTPEFKVPPVKTVTPPRPDARPEPVLPPAKSTVEPFLRTSASFDKPADSRHAPVPSQPETSALTAMSGSLERHKGSAPAARAATRDAGFSLTFSRQVPAVPTPAPAPLLQVPLRLVGVVGNLYVVLESDRGMVLMDQHAAHERVLYEQMLNRLEQGDAPSQRLLLAETVELSPRDAVFVREHLEVLGRLGVGLSEFGDRTFLLDALPPFVKPPDSRGFVLELIDELAASGQGVNSFRLGEQMVARTVCRHAVKANDALTARELEGLVDDLRKCAMPYTCPHGRPTLIEMNYRELEKKFGRTQ